VPLSRYLEVELCKCSITLHPVRLVVVCCCDRLALLAEGPEHNIGNLGSIRWHLCLCLLLSWLLVMLFVSRGIKSSGKVVDSSLLTFEIFLSVV